MKQQDAESTGLQTLDQASANRVAGGLIGPDGSLDDFPRWVWPYINVARPEFSANVFAAKQFAAR